MNVVSLRTLDTRLMRLPSSFVYLAALGVATPVLWFPWRLPLVTVVAGAILGAVLLISWRGSASAVRRLGLSPPLALLLLSACVSSIAITNWTTGLPKLLGIFLGAALIATVPRVVRDRITLRWTVAALAGALLGLSAVGMLGLQWSRGKFAFLDAIAEPLQAAIRPGGTSAEWVNPNQLAGALLLVLLPVLAVLLQAGIVVLRRRTRFASRPELLLLTVSALAGVITLLVTQSRSGLGGIGFAALLYGGYQMYWVQRATWIPRRVTQAAILLFLAGIFCAALLAGSLLIRWHYEAHVLGIGEFLDSRIELWHRATAMVQDSPITGVGLGQFDEALHAFYPSLLIPASEYMPHPHNLLLAFAAELGLPGAFAVGWLIYAYLGALGRAIRSDDPLIRSAALGLLLGTMAFLVYGFTEAMAPGARGGTIFWVVLSIGTAVASIAADDGSTHPPALPGSAMRTSHKPSRRMSPLQ